MAEFTLTVGDQLPLIQQQLLNGDKTVFDLTNATGVSLQIQDEDNARPAFGGPADIIGAPTNGTVRYSWQPTDSAVPGVYNFRWVVTFPSALPITFPNGPRPLKLVISQRT